MWHLPGTRLVLGGNTSVLHKAFIVGRAYLNSRWDKDGCRLMSVLERLLRSGSSAMVLSKLRQEQSLRCNECCGVARSRGAVTIEYCVAGISEVQTALQTCHICRATEHDSKCHYTNGNNKQLHDSGSDVDESSFLIHTTKNPPHYTLTTTNSPPRLSQPGSKRSMLARGFHDLYVTIMKPFIRSKPLQVVLQQNAVTQVPARSI